MTVRNSFDYLMEVKKMNKRLICFKMLREIESLQGVPLVSDPIVECH